MTVSVAPLFLSRLFLNPASRQVRSELGRPYEMHRTLMSAFPMATDKSTLEARKEFGVLFRAEVDERCGLVKVYVQSCVEPDWSCLASRRNYLLDYPDAPKDLAKACGRMQNGQVYSFRLRANPTRRIAKVVDGQERWKGKRVGLLREEEQIAWLMRKGQQRELDKTGGFEILVQRLEGQTGETRQIPQVQVCGEGNRTGCKEAAGYAYEMTHLAVRFDGLARVTNADAFRETIACGIGPGKAFGFGLLSLAPVR